MLLTNRKIEHILLKQNKEERCIRSHPQQSEGVNRGKQSLRAFLCHGTGAECSVLVFCCQILYEKRRCFGISSNVHQINEEIRDSEIRLISATGEQLGIMSAAQAQHIADEQGLDLVKISPQAKPPVCKLMDYGKFRFEQGKREKEARKNQHVVEIKEVRMSPGIDVGDFNTKLKNAQKFIADGNRVKVSVRFRGREMAHTDIGRDLLVRFAESVAEVANLDKEPKMEGRSMSIFLSPKAGK